MQASVVIPAYNAEAHVERAIRSVLRQTETSLEVIVVDDGSTDRTAEIVTKLAAQDARVRLLRHDQNRGAPAARNSALDHVRGRWLAMLDADDWFQPTRIERLITEAERAQVKAIADNQLFTFDEAFRPWRTLIPASKPPLLSVDALELLRRDWPGGVCNLGHLKPTLLIEFLRTSGIRYDERLRHSYDFYFLLALLLELRSIPVVDEPLYVYCLRAGSLSSSPSARRYEEASNAAGRFALLFRESAQPEAASILERRQAALSSQATYKAFLARVRRSPSASIELLRSGPLRRSVALGLGRALRVRGHRAIARQFGRLLWAVGLRSASP